MDKLDLKKADRPFYAGKVGQWTQITLPAVQYLAIEGRGDPGGAIMLQLWQRYIRWLTGLSLRKRPRVAILWCRHCPPFGGRTISMPLRPMRGNRGSGGR